LTCIVGAIAQDLDLLFDLVGGESRERSFPLEETGDALRYRRLHGQRSALRTFPRERANAAPSGPTAADERYDAGFSAVH
jgi:hypothetical protein